MPRGFQPRPGRHARRPSGQRSGLTRDLVEELRRTAKPGHAEQAVAALERAADLIARGDPRRAATEAEKAKAIASRSAAVREVLGLAYYGAERYRDALREMQAYRRISGRADQNHIIADCHRALGHPEKAVPLATEALRARIPDEAKAEALVVGASALADLGRFEEALTLLRRFPTREEVGRPHDLRVWYVTGDVLTRAGRHEEAAREFRKIIRHDPGAFDTAERLARLA